MIEVFKIIHNYYDTGASVKLNFNAVGSTRGNTFKLRKDMCRYDITKYSCCYLVVNVEKSRTARSDKNTNSCPKTLIKQLLGTYSITDCTAYAATVPRPVYESSFWTSKEEYETSHSRFVECSQTTLSKRHSLRPLTAMEDFKRR